MSLAVGENRIVLPLDAVRRAVAESCRMSDCAPGDHASWCLGPYLEQRDHLMTHEHHVKGPSPDCRDGKHVACTGCLCDCHRHSNRKP